MSFVTDLLMLVMTVAFFALAYAFVKACEHILGPDLEASRAETNDAAPKGEAA
jgi:hypothetical protein